MKKLTLVAASALALLASTASALESGAFYIKPVVSYNIGDIKNSFTYPGNSGSATPSTKTDTAKTHNAKGFRGGVGFGYNISEELRTDVTFTAGQIKKKKASGTINSTAYVDKATYKMDGYNILVNGYYHFATGNTCSPYIGAGVGIGRMRAKATDITGSITDKEAKTKNTTKAVYKGTVGIDFALAKGVNFDLSYGIGNQGQTNTKHNTTATANNLQKWNAKADLIQSVEAAVRFSF